METPEIKSHSQFLKNVKNAGITGTDLINQYKYWLTNPENLLLPFATDEETKGKGIISQTRLYDHLRNFIGFDQNSLEFNELFMTRHHNLPIRVQGDI